MSFNKVNQTTGKLTRIAGNGDIPIDSTPTQGSTNAVQSGGTFSAIKAVSDNVDEVSSQMQTLTNYVNNGIYYDGAKNLLPLLISKIKAINTTGSWSKSDENDVYTIRGVTYTITSNANGVITNIKASGTGASSSPFSDLYITLINTYDAFAMYELIKNNTLTVATHAVNSVNFILDGQYNDSWKTVQAISGKADITLNISTSNNVQTCIRIVAGRTVTNEDITPIMAQKSLMDIDDSFSPYAKTNKQLTQDSVTWNDYSEVGAVNMIYPNNVSKDENGVTYTLNDDGTVVASGTPTGVSGFGWVTYNGNNLVGKTLEFSCETTNAYPNAYFAVICRETAGGTNLLRKDVFLADKKVKVVFTVPSNTKIIIVNFNTNTNTTDNINTTLKPMITPASYNGPYVPYAKTNKELTDFVSDVETLTDTTQITVADSSALAINDVRLTKKGNVLCGFVSIQCKTALQYNTTLFTLPTGFIPSAFCNIIGVEQNTINGEINMFGLWSSGIVQLLNGVASASKNYRIQIIGII